MKLSYSIFDQQNVLFQDQRNNFYSQTFNSKNELFEELSFSNKKKWDLKDYKMVVNVHIKLYLSCYPMSLALFAVHLKYYE